MTNEPTPTEPTPTPTDPSPPEPEAHSVPSDKQILDLANSPHDGFAKHTFIQLDVATALWKGQLPAKVTAKLNWSTLAVEPSSFVKTDLKQIHSDILYSILCGDKKILLYLMFEHQTSVEKEMRVRLLRYMVETWQTFLLNNTFPLPVIIPLVLSQGPDRWTPSLQFQELFKIPEDLQDELLPFIPKFCHILVDLTQKHPAKEELDPILQIVLQIMKVVRQEERDMLAFFAFLEAQFRLLPPELLPVLLLYALSADKDLDVEKIYHTIDSTSELKNKVMSTAQKLVAQGFTAGEIKGFTAGEIKGFTAGEIQGEARGEARGKALGKIQVLQGLMGKSVSTSEDLAPLTLEQLNAAFDALQQEYAAKFKR